MLNCILPKTGSAKLISYGIDIPPSPRMFCCVERGDIIIAPSCSHVSSSNLPPIQADISKEVQSLWYSLAIS